MRNRLAFTVVELLVVVAIIIAVLAILLPALSSALETANRGVCASNLANIYKAMYTYAGQNEGAYPEYGEYGANLNQKKNRNIRGFRPITRTFDAPRPGTTLLYNNGTAAMFMLVRDGSTAPKQYICPSRHDGMADPLTLVRNNAEDPYNDAVPFQVRDVWDFAWYYSFQYSFINMHDVSTGNRWRVNATYGQTPDWILMSDDNNSAENVNKGLQNQLHTNELSSNPEQLLIELTENSTNHRQDGQNVMHVDGRVEFATDPFHGPNQDNIFARNVSANTTMEDAQRPETINFTMGTDDNKDDDVVLVPVTGNFEDDSNNADKKNLWNRRNNNP